MIATQGIKRILKDNNLRINKSLGQNFLIDEKIMQKIIGSSGVKKDDIILEIGPGLGTLTIAIAGLCRKVIGVEKDKGLSSFIKNHLKDIANIYIIQGDILKYDIGLLYRQYKRKIKVIGNLPFYITSPIIFYLIKNKRYLDSIFITVQKEVARRIISGPGSKDYGILSCSVRYHTLPELKIQIPKSAFFPIPKVDACFLELKILKEPPVEVNDEETFFKVIKAAFNQRRKTLLNALCQSPLLMLDKNNLKVVFNKLGLDNGVRAERLSLQDFALLADNLPRE